MLVLHYTKKLKIIQIIKFICDNNTQDAPSLPPSQISAEKKQREHLLQLNQILAQQVMQMSKIVAGNETDEFILLKRFVMHGVVLGCWFNHISRFFIHWTFLVHLVVTWICKIRYKI